MTTDTIPTPGVAFHSMADFKAANKASGRFWFSPDTMRFFRSKVEGGLISFGSRQFFITSEQFVPSEGPADPRKFTVREALADGSVDTVGEFQGFATKDAAVLSIYDEVTV
jgi:hypothetical protein